MMFPERRRHVRIVTLRNFGLLALAALVAFAAISIHSERRGRHMHDYGRLSKHQVPAVVERQDAPQVETVEEAATTPQPQTSIEPMMVVPVDPPPPTQTYSSQVIPTRGDARVAIVGGPEGVTVVQQPRRRRVLAGGFGR